jgi:hypothetical protein
LVLHLVKLCVGADSIADLKGWVEERVRERRGPPRSLHVTRMVPTRAPQIVEGGSLYWVIRGQLSARQRVLEIDRCRLWLDPEVVELAPRPMRAFQGWRYLKASDAPADLGKGGEAAMPEELRRALGELGLL